MKHFLLALSILSISINWNCMGQSRPVALKRLLQSGSSTYAKPKSVARIPIIAWVGIPQDRTSIKNYQEMKAAGITHSFAPFSDANALAAALDVAQKTGIKLFAWCPELLTSPEITVKRFMKNSALAGYFLQDEPTSGHFPNLTIVAKRIRAVDNEHICYVNLLPNYAANNQLGTNTYKDYVNKFINEVPVQILSFDHYPVTGVTNRSIRAQWYNNLEIIAEASKKADKPFWAFALSTSFPPYPISTLSTLRLQVFSDLAYGAQAIQYFTYWTLYDPAVGYNNAPISSAGVKTGVYAIMQQMNKEINAISGVFSGAKVITVSHTGDLPLGTKPLGRLPKPIKSLKTDGLGAVVSIMQNNLKTYLVVVNRDFTAPMALTINCAKGVSQILKTGVSIPQNSNNQTVNIEPGDVAIFNWPDSLN